MINLNTISQLASYDHHGRTNTIYQDMLDRMACSIGHGHYLIKDGQVVSGYGDIYDLDVDPTRWNKLVVVQLTGISDWPSGQEPEGLVGPDLDWYISSQINVVSKSVVIDPCKPLLLTDGGVILRSKTRRQIKQLVHDDIDLEDLGRE